MDKFICWYEGGDLTSVTLAVMEVVDFHHKFDLTDLK